MSTFPLDRRTELQIGGVWTDVTGDVRESDPITITRGSGSEAAKPAPSKCRLKLNNRHGKYSPRNPMSPYYGLIGRNTPIRVSVKGPESYLVLDGAEGSHATTPDTAALDITGDLDVRVEATVDWWDVDPQILIGKWETTGAQRSWLMKIEAGTLRLYFSTDGVFGYNSVQTLPALPRRASLRVTVDADNGAGGWTMAMYWAESLDGPWTVIGDPFVYNTDGPQSIYVSTAPLRLAPLTATITPPWLPMAGRVHRAEVRSGIDGTIVAAPDFRVLAEGTTGWSDSAGRAWALAGAAAVSDREYRFHGEVSSWPSRWDVSGADVWVPIEASGVLRRMGQGKKALGSTLRRRIPAFSPLAYWPCEDEDGALQAYSPIEGVGPLVVSSGWRFGQDTTLAGSSALPSVEAAATMRGAVPAPAVDPGEWSVHMLYAVDEAPAADAEFLSWHTTGTVRRWRILQRSGAATIQGYDSAGNILVTNVVIIGADVFNGWQRLYFRASEAGGTVTWRLSWVNIGGSAGGFGSTYSGSTGRVTEVRAQFGTVTGLRVGHIGVLSEATDVPYLFADHGFSGDTALDRMARLANEESDQTDLSWIDGDTTRSSERLGPQRPATLLALLEEAAATDGGILYERLDRTALVYRDRASLYNQRVALALDYTAAGEVPPPLEPVEDDQRLRNDVTVTRSGGSSGRAVLEEGPLSVLPPPDGVGLYDEALTLSLYTDDQPARIAQWRMHLGTWDEARYPTITVWLHAAPHLVDSVLDLDIGDRVTISDLPPWLPPGLIDQHMRGYTETLGLYTWVLAMNCTPAGPWTVGVIEDPVLGRADTDGTVLAAAVTDAQTGWPLTVTAGPDWITTTGQPAMFPVDVTAGGEQATVTAITGVAEDAFARTVAAGWGTADSGQAWVTDGGAAVDYAVTSGTARHLLPLGTFLATVVPVTTADVDLVVDFMLPVAPAGDSAYVYPVIRYADDTHMYFARLQVGSTGVMSLTLRKRVGSETLLDSYATGVSFSAGTWYRLRLAMTGSTLTAKFWVASGSVPDAWQVSAVDTDLTGPASVGLRSFIGGSSTNTIPFTVQYDGLYVGPQQMTVVRAVNGIAKAHAAGTPLSLTHPMRAAL